MYYIYICVWSASQYLNDDSEISGVINIGSQKYWVLQILGLRNIGSYKYWVSEIPGLRSIGSQKYWVSVGVIKTWKWYWLT